MDFGPARSPQSRVAGNRDLSGLRIVVRNGDGRRRSIRCTIHLVPGLWRAYGGLVGGPALAAENKLANSISAKRPPMQRSAGANTFAAVRPLRMPSPRLQD